MIHYTGTNQCLTLKESWSQFYCCALALGIDFQPEKINRALQTDILIDKIEQSKICDPSLFKARALGLDLFSFIETLVETDKQNTSADANCSLLLKNYLAKFRYFYSHYNSRENIEYSHIEINFTAIIALKFFIDLTEKECTIGPSWI